MRMVAHPVTEENKHDMFAVTEHRLTGAVSKNTRTLLEGNFPRTVL